MGKSKLFVEAKKNKLKLSLKDWRELNGFDQQEVADQLGIRVETWSNYERGKTFPRVPVIMKIEKVLDVEYNDILFLPKDYGLTVNDGVVDESKQPA